MTNARKGSLTYLRPFGGSEQAQLYMHRWATGYQQLIFCSTADAQAFARENAATFSGPKKERTKA